MEDLDDRDSSEPDDRSVPFECWGVWELGMRASILKIHDPDLPDPFCDGTLAEFL